MVRATAIAAFVLFFACASDAGALASHVGWPPYVMLLMNKTDSDRPLDARPGHDPFGGQDSAYSCDELRDRPSDSCGPEFVRRGSGYVMTNVPGNHRLLGGHGDDTIHAGDQGDVIWGDYKPCCQPSRQHDRLFGGAGPDFIYPSHGRNDVVAGAGTDVIHGHFGHGTIDCGPGRDIVYVHGARRHAYRLHGCEVVSTATGQSAPPWLLRQLPWRTCPKGTTYRRGACRAPGDHPENDISQVDFHARFDAGRFASDLATQRCAGVSPATVAALDDAVTVLKATVPGVVVPVVIPDEYGDCYPGGANPSSVVQGFDFAALLSAYGAVACKNSDPDYRATADEIAQRLAGEWQSGLDVRNLSSTQQAAVYNRVAAAAKLC